MITGHECELLGLNDLPASPPPCSLLSFEKEPCLPSFSSRSHPCLLQGEETLLGHSPFPWPFHFPTLPLSSIPFLMHSDIYRSVLNFVTFVFSSGEKL